MASIENMFLKNLTEAFDEEVYKEVVKRLSMENTLKAKDLRIGNWYYEYGIPKQATAFLIGNLERIEKEGKIAIDVSAIPLTPEILEKAGFKFGRGSHRMFWRINKFEIRYYDSGFAKFIISSSHHVELTSLHKLQNLYFVITEGEELNIQL